MIDTHHRPRDFHLDRGRVIVLPSFVSPVRASKFLIWAISRLGVVHALLPPSFEALYYRKVGCFFFEKIDMELAG